MSHSLAQSTQLICPHCNRPFDAEIWLIVDAAERPDLFEKVKQDKLHDLTCPHCGFVEQADAPLLLYLDSPLPGGEGAEVRVLFSPAQRTSAEQDEEAARKLVARLRKSLGATWQDEWLVQMPVILRPGLSLALTEGLEAAQQKVREQTDVRVPPELREVLAELARRGATIRSVEDLQRALEQHADLREKLERLSTQAQPDPTLSRRFQELVGLHTQAEHAPALWPQVLRGWQELIAQAEEREESQLAAYARANLANTYSRLYEVTGDSSWAEQAEALFEELSRVFTRQQAPQTWGITQHALGNLFARRYERSGAEAHAQAAEAHYRDALLECRRDAAPSRWATVQHALGNLFARRYERSGEEAHAQAAEAHYRNALLEYRRDAAPSDWAMTQHALGNLFARRYERSGKEAYAQAAEAHYRDALLEYRRDVAPSHWATAHHSLGNLFLRRYERSGEEAHARAAETHYRDALLEYRRNAAPSDWAMTQHALGNLFARRYERSGKEAHAQAAEAHYRDALSEYRHDTAPSDWAMTQHALGNLFLDRYERSGEEAHAQAAEAHYRNALLEYRRDAAPSDWAMTQHALGTLFLNRYERSGEEAHARAAEAHYRDALSEYRRDTAPSQWATVQHSLGTLFLRRFERSGEEAHARAAEAHYRDALEIRHRDTAPSDWAMTQHALGNLFLRRFERSGEEAHAGVAAAHYRNALSEYRRDTAPSDWAMIQHALGNLFLRRYERSGKETHARVAEAYYRDALSEYRRDAAPSDWATVQHSLGTLFLERYERSGEEAHAQAAEAHYRNALGVRRRDAAPSDWATAQHSLGNLFLRRYERSREEAHAQAAEAHYRDALEVRRRDAAPSDWAMTQHALGSLFLLRYERSGAEAHAQAAEAHYRGILDLSSEIALPAMYPFRAARALSRVHFRAKRWQACLEAASRALSEQEELLAAGLTRSGKKTWLREARGLTAQAAWSCLQLNDKQQAVTHLERGRAYLLREAMGRIGRDLERLPELGFAHLYERFVRARREEEHLTDLMARHGAVSYLAQRESARRELAEAAEAIRREAGATYAEYRFFLRSLPFEVIQQQAADAPLVYLAETEYGGFALIVRAGAEVEVVDLPDLTETVLREKIVGSADGPAIGGYLGAYWRWRSDPRDAQARAAWFAALEGMLAWLGQVAMNPLVERLEALSLPEGALVRLVPGGWLGLLPLHAALIPGSSPDGRKTYALDRYTFTYVPSAQALYYARPQAARPVESLLLVDNPDGTLVFSALEVKAAEDAFRGRTVTCLAGEHATKEKTRQAMSELHVLHFSTHGHAGWTESEHSSITLADGALTLPEIFALRLECPRLAVLSACETSVPLLDNPEEVETLPSGLMLAGVPGGVGSLWAVNAISTALLMTWFYHFWREEGMEFPYALRRAQIHLRDGLQSEAMRAKDLLNLLLTMRDFAHPYYWAGFTFTGL